MVQSLEKNSELMIKMIKGATKRSFYITSNEYSKGLVYYHEVSHHERKLMNQFIRSFIPLHSDFESLSQIPLPFVNSFRAMKAMYYQPYVTEKLITSW